MILEQPLPQLMVTVFTAVFRRANRSRSRQLSAEPALTRIRAERISSWQGENSTPGGTFQGHGASSRQMRQSGPGMAGVGANRLPRENHVLFNNPPVSHPPALQSRSHHRSRSSGGGHQQAWVDDSAYNGPGYQPRY